MRCSSYTITWKEKPSRKICFAFGAKSKFQAHSAPQCVRQPTTSCILYQESGLSSERNERKRRDLLLKWWSSQLEAESGSTRLIYGRTRKAATYQQQVAKYNHRSPEYDGTKQSTKANQEQSFKNYRRSSREIALLKRYLTDSYYQGRMIFS